MSQFPSMPMFVGDMLADTDHLTNEEFGAYHRLLYAMWRRNGWVPDDDHDLARICHVSGRKWHELKKRLLPFLISEEGELTQKKLQTIRNKCLQISAKNAQNSREMWAARKNKNNEMGDANGYAKSMHRARANPKPNKESSMSVPSGHAREGNGSAAMAPSPGLGGRYGATPSKVPIASARAPPDAPFPPQSKLLERVYGNKKTARSQNGTHRGRHRSRKGKAAAPGGKDAAHQGAAEGTEAEKED